MRITSVPGKIAYVVAAPIVLLLLQMLAVALDGFRDAGLAAACGVLAQLALVLVGVRTFRGEGEPIRPPRAWWRMTARPPAGFVLGALFLAQAAWSDAMQGPGAVATAATAVAALIGLAYVAASIALVRHEQADRSAD